MEPHISSETPRSFMKSKSQIFLEDGYVYEAGFQSQRDPDHFGFYSTYDAALRVLSTKVRGVLKQEYRDENTTTFTVNGCYGFYIKKVRVSN